MVLFQCTTTKFHSTSEVWVNHNCTTVEHIELILEKSSPSRASDAPYNQDTVKQHLAAPVCAADSRKDLSMGVAVTEESLEDKDSGG